MTKNILFIFACSLVVVSYFLLHRLVGPSLWLSLGLAVGALWYIFDPVVLFPRYRALTELPWPLSRSFWLLIVYWPLTLFVMTSTGSWLAEGLMLALGLGLALELLWQFSTPEQLKVIFHFPVQSKWQATELQVLSLGWLIGWLVVVALTII